MSTEYTITAKYPSKIFQYEKTAMFQGTLEQLKDELVKFLDDERAKTAGTLTNDGLVEVYSDGWVGRIELSEADDIIGFRTTIYKTDKVESGTTMIVKSLAGDALSFCLCPPLGFISLLITLLGGGIIAAQTKIINKIIETGISRRCADHGLVLVK